MSEFKKPPLGACPADVRARERILELAEAIVRNSQEGRLQDIKDWAIEILEQIGIADNHGAIKITGFSSLHRASEEEDEE